RQVYEFDNFRLDAGERQLSRDGAPITLPSKAFDLLLALVENSGRLVEKGEIYSRVWGDQVVEESNLTVQISAIRKALGERTRNPRYIVTVPGYGYRFVGDVVNPAEDREVVIETQTLSHIVIEKEEADDDNSRQRLSDDDSLKGVKALPPVPPGQQMFAGRLWRRTESPARRAFVALAVVLAAGLALLVYYSLSKRTSPNPQLTLANQIKSIAVLPFKPLVADSRDESLEMGMADTLIARLSNIRGINVRPISAVRKYANIEQDAIAAGREQKVDAVLDGQIQKSGGRIRVTVRLVRVEDGAPIWASQLDDKMTDIFAVQDSISERVAGVLALKLTGEEKGQLAKHDTDNTEAYQLYLIGRYHLNRLTDDGFLKSLEYFQQAIEKDSNFAVAYTGMAESYNALGDFNVLRPKEVYPKARTAVQKALELDDTLAQAHTALAVVKVNYDWDWSGAEREFKRAIELNAGDSEAHGEYGFYLAFMGQFDEAIAEMRRSQELDPVSLVRITGVAQVLLIARRYDESIEQCRKALEMDPNLGFAHWLLGCAYLWKGMPEPAIQALQKSIPLSGDSPDEPASLGLAYALSGKSGEARKILEELTQRSKRKYLSSSVIAVLHAALGERDQAFALLDKAYDERDTLLLLLKVEPMFDPLRSDPRFADLMRRVGFPE
ncbi:MAG TPA: winged helix-turn-helix domain-containing protein, partial [Blastocatellia bacterium]|nr:winged helix-turn-helix domain-containing protein [Blastocatellia bacterium]